MDCSPWNSPGQNTGVRSLSLLQGIFPTQGSNPGLPHCIQILYQLSCKALKSLSSTLIRKHQFFCSQPFLVKLSHQYMTTGKTVALTGWTFVNKAMSLLFNVLSRRVIAFFPRSKRLWISRLQSPSLVIWEPKKRKSVIASIFFPFYLLWSDAIILVFECWVLSQLFHCPLSPSSRGCLVPLH